MLCDEQSELGGSFLAEPEARIDGKAALDWLRETLDALGRRADVTLLPRTTAFGWYPDNLIGLVQRVTDHIEEPDLRLPRERLWHVRASRVVIAAGALERPLLFSDNDRPGVMLADAARIYLQRYGVKVGTRAVIATSDDSAYAAGVALREAGVVIGAVADLRSEVSGMAQASGLPVRTGASVVATRGRQRVNRAILSDGGTIPCDLVLMCGGWTPSVHLYSQSRAKLHFDERLQAFLPGEWTAQVRSAGACNGTLGLAACLEEGYAAGDLPRKSAVADAPTLLPSPAVTQASTISGKSFVDFQNDVTAKDLAIAAREGFRSIEHVKRYTTTGMATDQGKTANMNALTVVASVTDRAVPEVGHTTFRTPYTPVTFRCVCGHCA